MNRILVAVLVSCLIVATVNGQRRQRNRQRGKGANCHLKEFEKCYDKLSKQSNDPESSKLITTSEGLDEICSQSKDVLKCVQGYLRKCGTPLQKELFEFGTEHFNKSVDLFCGSGSSRAALLKQTPCIHEKVIKSDGYRDQCVTPFLASLDGTSTLKETDEKLDAVCCSYNRWNDCSSRITTEKCGADATDALDRLFKKAFAGIADMICPSRHFDFNAARCKKFYAPPGTKAKGKLSENPVTKYIALYFGFLF